MAEDSRYYWIKLRTDFFDQDTMDFLLSQKNGCEYVVLYQMLCLSTANNNGELSTRIGEIIVPYTIDKIVRDTKYFDFDTVTIAIELFKKLGLVYESDGNGILTIANHEDMVGSETGSAVKKREYRKKKKLKAENAGMIEDKNSDNVSDKVKDNVPDNVRQENRDKRLEIRDKRLEVESEENSSPTALIDQLIYDYGNDSVSKYIQRVKDWYTKHHKKLEETEFEETVARWMREDNVTKIDHDVDKYKVLINNF